MAPSGTRQTPTSAEGELSESEVSPLCLEFDLFDVGCCWTMVMTLVARGRLDHNGTAGMAGPGARNRVSDDFRPQRALWLQTIEAFARPMQDLVERGWRGDGRCWRQTSWERRPGTYRRAGDWPDAGGTDCLCGGDKAASGVEHTPSAQEQAGAGRLVRNGCAVPKRAAS